jgi:uncharacterized OB-fold protein
MTPPGATVTTDDTPLTLAEFFDGVRIGRIVAQRCLACGELAVPPKLLCSACHGARWARTPVRGDAEVLSYTVIRVPPGRLASEAPYAIVVARFAEGVALLGRVSGIALETLRVGLPVRVVPPADPAADPPVVTFAARA